MRGNRETEIKLRIPSAVEVIEKLLAAGAKDKREVFQRDILYDYADGTKTFGTFDQALRLRIEKRRGSSKGIITFKGTPYIDNSGKKTRDEFETGVDDPKALEQILFSIGFEEAMRIEKKRHEFELDDVEVAVDEAEFGNFLELEGEKDEIDRLIKKLGFSKYPVETKPYFKLLIEWQKDHQ